MDAVAVMKPFGMNNTLGEDMVGQWQDAVDGLYGIGYANLKTPYNSSSTLQAELKALRGTDLILDLLLDRGPVTRESYLEYNFPDGVPDPMPGELEANLPRPL